MHDPREGVTPTGMVRTGASRAAMVAVYDEVLRAAEHEVAEGGALYVYGSVATGTAVVPTSDVDLLAVGIASGEAARICAELSARFRTKCREVSVAPATWEELASDSDEAHGLRVFLRHYCVHLAGPDPGSELREYPADIRAARGFNGDIARHARRWRTTLENGGDIPALGTRIARKTLLAVAGIVSMRDATWSTDRRASATRWNDLEPDSRVGALVAWLDVPPRNPAAVDRALRGPVTAVVRAFEAEIGLWSE